MKTNTKLKGWEIKNWLDSTKDHNGMINKYFNLTNSINMQRDYYIKYDKFHNYYKIYRYTKFFGGEPEDIICVSSIIKNWGF